MRECGPGRRPIAWWVCEGRSRYPGFDREKLALYEAGLLREDEIRELRRIGLVRADEKGAGANAAPAREHRRAKR